jgi:hypothetical protein
MVGSVDLAILGSFRRLFIFVKKNERCSILNPEKKCQHVLRNCVLNRVYPAQRAEERQSV